MEEQSRKTPRRKGQLASAPSGVAGRLSDPDHSLTALL